MRFFLHLLTAGPPILCFHWWFPFFFFLNDPNCNPKVSGSSVPKYKMAVCAEHKSLKNKKDLGHIQAQSIEGCGVQFQTHASRSLLFSAVFYHAPFQ